jgi:Domain of unknown function (DUF6438)
MRILFFFLFTSICEGLQANEIDRLHTEKDVARFVKKVAPEVENWELFSDRAVDSDVLNNRFYKLDLDENGLTDLVVNGNYLLVIMDMGGQYSFFNLRKDEIVAGMLESLIAIDSVGRPKKLVVSLRKGQDWRSTAAPEYYPDTLVCHFGLLMEYNAHPTGDFRFEAIKVSTTRCFGSCPVFAMEIRADRGARYHAIAFNDEEGEFRGSLSKKQFDTLTELLRYLPLDSLEANYRVNWTDDQTIFTEIRYNGHIKKIEDYGKLGTMGLQRLYDLFFRWKKELEWTENQ